LADFLPNWDISGGFLSVYIINNAGGISAAIRELYCTFADFLQNWNFPLHNINFAKRKSEAAMGRVENGGHYIFFWVPHNSLRMRRSSVGYSIDQKGTA
jgi:hypothetical protein